MGGGDLDLGIFVGGIILPTAHLIRVFPGFKLYEASYIFASVNQIWELLWTQCL